MVATEPAGVAVAHGTEPFRWWVIENAVEPVSAAAIPPADWHGWEAKYANDVEAGKLATRNLDRLPPDFARVRDVVATMRAGAPRWSEIAGIDGLTDDPHLHGGGVHCSIGGSWLQIHGDYESHPLLPGMERRLNLIAFLHPEWNPGWGGQLLLCDGNGRAVVEFDPAPGRLVAFECGPASFHGVRQTRPTAPPRLSAAVYFLAPTRPAAARTRAMFLPNRSGPGKPPAEVRLCPGCGGLRCGTDAWGIPTCNPAAD